MTRTKIAALTIGLTLAAVSPVLATPAQARQIKSLKATIAKDTRTIKALRAQPPFVVNASSVSSLTPAEAWALVPLIYNVLVPGPATINCGPNNYLTTAQFGDGLNSLGSGWTESYYTFDHQVWSAGTDPNPVCLP